MFLATVSLPFNREHGVSDDGRLAAGSRLFRIVILVNRKPAKRLWFAAWRLVPHNPQSFADVHSRTVGNCSWQWQRLNWSAKTWKSRRTRRTPGAFTHYPFIIKYHRIRFSSEARFFAATQERKIIRRFASRESRTSTGSLPRTTYQFPPFETARHFFIKLKGAREQSPSEPVRHPKERD